MADNVTLNAGSGGANVATDDIGGVQYPRSKIVLGVDGVSDGDVSSSNPMPVGGTVAENAAAAGAPVPAGGRYDATPRTLGDGDRGEIALDADGAVQVSDGGNSLTIDGTVTANAGTGTFTVDGSGVTQPVSAASLPLPTGAATAANQSTGNTSLSNIEAAVAAEDAALGSGVLLQGDDGTDRKNINVDATTGDVQVDVTNTVTVSGTVTADAGTGPWPITDNAGSITVDTAGGALDVSGATVTVDLGANNDVTVQGEDAENAPAAANPVQVGGRYDLTPRVLGDGDVGAVALDPDGAVHIADGGNSLTVDGTVTANAGTGPWPVTDNAGSLTVDTAGGALDVSAATVTVTGTVTADAGTGPFPVSDNGGNLSIDFAGTAPTLNTGAVDAGTLRVTVATDDTVTVDNGGTFAVQSTLQTGSNLVGDVGLSGARTSGGTTPHYNDGTATETEVKGSAGQIYWIHCMNLSASVVYLQLFNALAATVTPGTTSPTNEFAIPTQGDTNGAGFALPIPNGLAYGTGITYFISTAKGGGSAATADTVLLNMGYA